MIPNATAPSSDCAKLEEFAGETATKIEARRVTFRESGRILVGKKVNKVNL